MNGDGSAMPPQRKKGGVGSQAGEAPLAGREATLGRGLKGAADH